MTVAAPPVAPVHENGINGVPGHHVNTMSLPRFHPIAMNPSQAIPPEHMMPVHHQFRPFHPPPPLQEPGPPVTAPAPAPAPPPPPPFHIDNIENRLRQLEHEEAARMAARSHLLAMRKREDEEFRRMTESAEAEEEDLRRQRKRLKRESMGLGYNNASLDSPPLRPTPPRRLSETNAATTLAFFKQQSPPEPRPIPPRRPPRAPAASSPSQHIHHDPTGATSIRRKQKYTIKNVEAWGERHGRPAAHDPSGRALWKRPSDGSLVYLTCPVSGCGKADFVTLHGFMCHLTKKHKDRSLGSQSRALEVCGIVFDPNAPLPPVATVNRASTEESRLESGPADTEGYQQEMEYSSASDSDEGREIAVKTEVVTDRMLPAPPMVMTPVPEQIPLPRINGSTKQSISSIIDRDPEETPRERLNSIPPRPVEAPMQQQVSPDHKPSIKDEAEFPRPHDHEKENTQPKDTAEAK
ncbi:hypothetical protein BO70DRAFT_111851 [Aspergillus heteromorphus CBS 117.55]|uniref:Uncharacterized protein n=1 Tax=Aspergillus heteromorphus CBS 117.55 TaxID=1448321 RepID=A0A317VJT9_9EURO|nr:uncharacterized protein BO70DRAFT_111851 [Aspergillus heteromorphus CBS 117.55]PWY73719.1 hypothetical protein BO70DRAFT_111851 [Aspergillus heteromorphus CBS 117.55]